MVAAVAMVVIVLTSTGSGVPPAVTAACWVVVGIIKVSTGDMVGESATMMMRALYWAAVRPVTVHTPLLSAVTSLPMVVPLKSSAWQVTPPAATSVMAAFTPAAFISPRMGEEILELGTVTVA